MIYHAGPRELLFKDIENHGVPDEDWKEFIMGEKTNDDLPPSRRGLYGAEQLSPTGMYGDESLARGLAP